MAAIKVLMFGNVPVDDLKIHFSQFGEVSSIQTPYFKPDHHTHNRGTYITFTVGTGVANACRERNHHVEGYRVQVSRHTGMIPQLPTGTLQSIPQQQVSRPTTVKVSMFNGELTNDQLHDLFSFYGELETHPIVRPGSPVYSYINFKHPEDAKHASLCVNDTQHFGVSLLARLYEKKSPKATKTPCTSPLVVTADSISQYPHTWESQRSNIELFEVNRQSQEWNDIATTFHTTMPNARLNSIKRIQNIELYDEYMRTKYKMNKKNKPLNERKLFHGSRDASPEKIYESDVGFDFRFSEEGLWGRGAYFAEKASLSNLYCHKNKYNHQKEIFLATVLTGETYWMDNKDPKLRIPPFKDGSSVRCDSVSADHPGGSVVFVVYNFSMAYPTHLISYT